MKPLLLVAVVAGIIFGVFSYLRFDEPEPPHSTQVVRAAHDLAPGTVFRMTDLEVANIDVAQLPKDAPRRFRDILGHAVTVPIAKGQIILSAQVSPDAKPSPLPPTREKPVILDDKRI